MKTPMKSKVWKVTGRTSVYALVEADTFHEAWCEANELEFAGIVVGTDMELTDVEEAPLNG